jgi:hypothetical protein
MEYTSPESVAIIGGGPVGALATGLPFERAIPIPEAIPNVKIDIFSTRHSIESSQTEIWHFSNQFD